MKLLYLIIATFISLMSCLKKDSYVDSSYTESRQTVSLKTSEGDIEVELFNDLAPKTVKNFVGLAQGIKQFTDPKNGKKTKRHFYDNTIFHRIIDNFMIQGGDPTGTGSGGPGYTFGDEIHLSNKNNRGTLSMANRGSHTNGSQFFINLVNNDYLNKNHTVFGKVIKGMEVINKIAKVKTDSRDRPLTPVILKSIRLKKE